MHVNSIAAPLPRYGLGGFKSANSLTHTSADGRELPHGQPQPRQRDEPEPDSWFDAKQGIVQGAAASFAFSLAVLGLGADASASSAAADGAAPTADATIQDLLLRAAGN